MWASDFSSHFSSFCNSTFRFKRDDSRSDKTKNLPRFVSLVFIHGRLILQTGVWCLSEIDPFTSCSMLMLTLSLEDKVICQCACFPKATRAVQTPCDPVWPAAACCHWCLSADRCQHLDLVCFTAAMLLRYNNNSISKVRFKCTEFICKPAILSLFTDLD